MSAFLVPLISTAAYEWCVVSQQQEMEEVRRDEALQLPEDLDYFAIDASLSAEVREKLDSNRPRTVRNSASAGLSRNPFCLLKGHGGETIRDTHRFRSHFSLAPVCRFGGG